MNKKTEIITKSVVNKRFIEVVNYLVKSDIDINKGVISEMLKLKRSTFSEILNERMNVSALHLSLLAENFDINSEWLLTGKGKMIQSGNQNDEILKNEQTDKLAQVNPNSSADDKQKVIEAYERIVKRHEKEIERYTNMIKDLQKEIKQDGELIDKYQTLAEQLKRENEMLRMENDELKKNRNVG